MVVRMGDAPARTIADIIGLTWGGVIRRGGPYVTPDEMLAWLDAQGYAIEITSARSEGERDIYGGLRRYRTKWEQADRWGGGTLWDEERDPDIEFEGPTLFAALEKAVRAVADLTLS